MVNICCMDCGDLYPELGVPYRCSRCGGLYDYDRDFPFDPTQVESQRTGIWKSMYAFGFGGDGVSLTLGEGNTPLVTADVFDREVYFKCEYANPTGSFKDRGMATLMAMLLSRKVTEAVEDSSGNAGASFAAYAARAGIKARVFIPETASGPKREQIEFYGAELIAVPGSRTKAGEAAMQAAGSGTVYASHAYLPFNLPGYATCAYEIFEQLDKGPGAVILPVGQGGLLLGMARGFQALINAEVMETLPILIGVQAAACAPLAAMARSVKFNGESPTVAEGVRVTKPLRASEVTKRVLASKGRYVTVAEADILTGRDALAQMGFYVEPTSALVWDGLKQILVGLPDPVVVVLTGSGYKTKV